MEQQEFKCKCGISNMTTWISNGERTRPCPECGRVYVGFYNKKTNKIEGKETK